MSILYAAQLFALGFNVTPLRPGTKIPKLDGWQKRKATIADFDEADGVGIVLGWQRNRLHLTTIDFDHRPADGVDATTESQRFIDDAPASLMARMPISRSMSGTGYHGWVYGKQTIRKHPLKNADGIGIGDVLGTGAQVVAPAPDQFIFGSLRDIPEMTWEEYEQIDPLLNRGQEQYEPRVKAAPVARPDGQLRPGDDYNQRGDFLGYLEAKGWKITRRSGNNYCLRRPGKNGGCHSATFNDGLFYVFSSSVPALIQGAKPFTAYALLEHHGDFAAAARELGRLGYGTPKEKKAPGRPPRLTADALYAFYQEQANGSEFVQVTQVEAARHFKVSLATVTTYDQQLQEEGRARRQIVKRGQPSILVLHRWEAQPAEIERETPTEALVETPCIDIRSHRSSSTNVTYARVSTSAETADSPEPAVTVSLDDAIVAVIGNDRPNVAKVAVKLAAYFPDHHWTDAAIAARYDAVLKQRQFQRAVERLTVLPQRKLDQQERWIDRVITEGPDGERGRLYWKARALAPHVNAEQERRVEIKARVNPKKRKLQPTPLLEGM